jgi:hypothetical protein
MRLSQMVLSRDAYKSMMHQAAEIAIAERGDQRRPTDAKEKLELMATEAVTYEVVLELVAEVYEARFSAKELEDIIAFYGTPTGMKWVKELPGGLAEINTKVGTLMQQRVPSLPRTQALATDLGSDEPKDKMTSVEAASARARLDKLRVNQASLSQKPVPPEGMSALLVQHFPRRARAEQVSGLAEVVVRILDDGRVDNMQVLHETARGAWPAADYGFGDACKSALKQQRWRPALDKSGKPVATDIRYTCEFEVDDSSPTLSISLDVAGTLYLDGQRIDEAALQEGIRVAHKADPDVKTVISADGRVKYSQVLTIIDLLRREKIARFAINTNTGLFILGCGGSEGWTRRVGQNVAR